MDLNIDDKIALVTGGSKGIGFGIASSLAQEGVGIVLLSRDKKSLFTAKEKINTEGGEVLDVIQADLKQLISQSIVPAGARTPWTQTKSCISKTLP